MEPVNGQKKIPLYEQVACKMTTLMDEGTFKAGDRIPSIRELSRRLNVSVNTVKVAYGLLEDRMKIEARPQSGYYVSAKLPEIPREPELGDRDLNPRKIGSTNLVLQLMQDIYDPYKVQFGAAIPDPELIPSEKLARILASETRKYPQEASGYAITPGSPRLRSAIAKRMIKAGCTLTPDDIVITTGGSEAVFMALHAICKPGDTLAIETPIYFNFLRVIKELGLKVIEIPSSPRDGISIDALKQAIEKNTIKACMVITNFNNPMGSCMSDERKKKLVELLSRENIPLIEDDINGDICFQGDRPSVAAKYDLNGNVLLCSSFSKTLAPGYRVGWIAPGKFKERVKRYKMATSIASATPTQLAVAEFLLNGGYEHHLRTIRKVYAKKTARMAEAVGRLFPPGTRVTRPQGGFSLWVELPKKYDTLELYAKADKEGISFAPGALFSASGKYGNCLRLNAGFWSDETSWALETLAGLLK